MPYFSEQEALDFYNRVIAAGMDPLSMPRGNDIIKIRKWLTMYSGQTPCDAPWRCCCAAKFVVWHEDNTQTT